MWGEEWDGLSSIFSCTVNLFVMDFSDANHVTTNFWKGSTVMAEAVNVGHQKHRSVFAALSRFEKKGGGYFGGSWRLRLLVVVQQIPRLERKFPVDLEHRN